jgi:hypothetical protein
VPPTLGLLYKPLPKPLGSFNHISSPLWLGSLVWSCARELEEIPPTGHRRAARFPLQVLLLLLLRWTGARGTSIHQTCVELRRCCHLWHLSLSTYSTTWPWGRFRLSPSTMFVRERLSHFWSLRYEHHRYSVALQLCRIDYGITSKDFFFVFIYEPQQPNTQQGHQHWAKHVYATDQNNRTPFSHGPSKLSYGQPNEMYNMVFPVSTHPSPPTPGPREPQKTCELPIAPLVTNFFIQFLLNLIKLKLCQMWNAHIHRSTRSTSLYKQRKIVARFSCSFVPLIFIVIIFIGRL